MQWKLLLSSSIVYDDSNNTDKDEVSMYQNINYSVNM